MHTVTQEDIIKILLTIRSSISWDTWKNKSSIMFTIKSKYGDAVDIDLVKIIYDDILKKELKDREKEGK